jgi:hypothetical protein
MDSLDLLDVKLVGVEMPLAKTRVYGPTHY